MISWKGLQCSLQTALKYGPMCDITMNSCHHIECPYYVDAKGLLNQGVKGDVVNCFKSDQIIIMCQVGSLSQCIYLLIENA